VYVPAVLEDGVTSPVEALIVNPAGELVYVPPVYAPVPLRVMFCTAASLQTGVVYEIVAVGKAVITTVAVAVTVPHPPDAGTVYVTVYVPAVLEEGVIAPVEALIVKPAGALV